MAERMVLGVDFSGAKNNDPWVTTAVMQGGDLSIKSCFPLPREELTSYLIALSENPDAVVGMDFPFGLPSDFIREELKMNATQMPEVWEYANGLDLPSHIPDLRKRLRNGDLKKYSKLTRKGDDKYFKESYSPLNPASPEMFPMTFYGMKMLHSLWTSETVRFRVPPLPEEGRNGPILLETMPGAVLSHIGFPHKVYKGYKNGANNRSFRMEILDELEQKSGVRLQNFSAFRNLCLGIHDCLDSLIAAIAAVLWAGGNALFYRPEDDPDPDILAAAQLEGWIYTPTSGGKGAS